MAAGPRFVDEPECRWEKDSEQHLTGYLLLSAPLTYLARSGELFPVPEGFRTDLASVPRWLAGFVRMTFRGPIQTAWAAILHDALYASGIETRARADELFWEALRATGESPMGARILWAGVRAGGWKAWREHARRRENGAPPSPVSPRLMGR